MLTRPGLDLLARAARSAPPDTRARARRVVQLLVEQRRGVQRIDGSVSSATPAGSVPTFTLSGCATSQKAVAQMLQRLRLIDGVSEVTLQSSTKRGGSGAAQRRPGGCPPTPPSSA